MIRVVLALAITLLPFVVIGGHVRAEPDAAA